MQQDDQTLQDEVTDTGSSQTDSEIQDLAHEDREYDLLDKEINESAEQSELDDEEENFPGDELEGDEFEKSAIEPYDSDDDQSDEALSRAD